MRFSPEDIATLERPYSSGKSTRAELNRYAIRDFIMTEDETEARLMSWIRKKLPRHR